MNSKDTNTVNKEDLIGSAVALDSMEYIIQDIREDFFDKFSTASNEDVYRIIYEFSRYRAKMNVVDLLFQQIRNEFKENNITAY